MFRTRTCAAVFTTSEKVRLVNRTITSQSTRTGIAVYNDSVVGTNEEWLIQFSRDAGRSYVHVPNCLIEVGTIMDVNIYFQSYFLKSRLRNESMSRVKRQSFAGDKSRSEASLSSFYFFTSKLDIWLRGYLILLQLKLIFQTIFEKLPHWKWLTH